MKILVVSDTHGKNKELLDSLKLIEKPDLLFHLGDYVGDGIILAEALELSPIIVMGNGDHPSFGYKEEEIIEIKGKRIFLTHGHRLGVSFNLNRISYRAKEVGADIALFGHTHKAIIEKVDGCVMMNPGSPSFPRASKNKKTYGIIEIHEEIRTKLIEI